MPDLSVSIRNYIDNVIRLSSKDIQQCAKSREWFLDRIRNEFKDRKDYRWGFEKMEKQESNFLFYKYHIWPKSKILINIPDFHFCRFQKIESTFEVFKDDILIEVDSVIEIKGPSNVAIYSENGSIFNLISDFYPKVIGNDSV